LIQIITIKNKQKVTQLNTFAHVDIGMTKCLRQTKNVQKPSYWTFELSKGTWAATSRASSTNTHI